MKPFLLAEDVLVLPEFLHQCFLTGGKYHTSVKFFLFFTQWEITSNFTSIFNEENLVV